MEDIKQEDLISIAISTGESNAKWMLENGSPQQKIIARRYLDCLYNVRMTSNKLFDPQR